MRRVAIACVCVVAASLAWAGDASARDYAGKYKSKITSPSGDVTKATVTITKVSETIYRAESKSNGFVELAVCFAEDDRLSCGFAPQSGARYVGFSIYVPDETGKLTGKWADNFAKDLGKEVLTPVD